MQIEDIISKIETFAPISLASEWDNSGWQVNLGQKNVSKILLALSPTLDVIEQAKELKCDLIITHHPLFFGKIKKLSSEVFTNKVAIEAIRNNIQIYSAHTNLDKTDGGINDYIAYRLDLKNLDVFGEFVRVGDIEPTPVMDFVTKIKEVFGCKSVKFINPSKIETVKTVAICSGAGGEFINSVKADIFITGDVKYHSAIEVMDKAVVDVGHFESEKIILPILREVLDGFDAIIAQEKEPWELL